MGDYILVMQTKTRENRKFKSKYKGIYMVAKILNKNRYIIQDIPGFNLTTKSYDSILSPNKLKSWIKIDQKGN